MNEEERKAIEKFIEKCNKLDESVEIKGVSVGEEYRILETVCKALDLVEKLQKENEELKNDYENLNNSVVVKNHCIKNSIPVQKVKDKIEEIKKEKNKFGNCLVEFYENELADRDIKILQELLEGRK